MQPALKCVARVPRSAFSGTRLLVNPVFQFALISALSAAVLIAALTWSIRQRRGLSVPHEARRVLVAIERASWATILRSASRLPPVAIGAVIVLQFAHFAFARRVEDISPLLQVVGAVATFALGLLTSFAMAHFCGSHSRKHAFLGVASAKVSISHSLGVSISGAALLVVAAEIAGMLSLASLHGVLWLLARGGVGASTATDMASTVASRLSPYFALGATFAALALQQTGVVCFGASRLSGPSGFEGRTGLPALDPRNPNVLVAAIGHQVGSVLPKVLDAFIGGALLATISLQLFHLPTATNWPARAAALGLLPILIRSFGLLATLVGLMTLRTTEHEDLQRAFHRSQLVAHAVLLSAIAGLVFWLVGKMSGPIAAAGVFGIGLSPSLGHLRTALFARKRIAKPPTDEAAGQGMLTALEAGSVGFAMAMLPIAICSVVIALFAVWFQRADVPQLELVVATLIGLSAPAALNAWGTTVILTRDFAALGRLVTSVGRITQNDEASFRLRRIAEATERATFGIEASHGDSGAMLCILTAAFTVFAHQTGATTASVSMPSVFAMSIWALFPVVLATIETSLASAKTARTQTNEQDRQLRGMRREGTFVLVPDDFVPSYRSCVELLARDAAQGGRIFTMSVVVLPVLAAQLAWALENTAGRAALSLAFYASIAAAAGLLLTNTGQSVAEASSLANRGNPSPGLTLSAPQVLSSEPARLVEFIGRSLGISVPLLTKAVALVTLAVSAMLI